MLVSILFCFAFFSNGDDVPSVSDVPIVVSFRVIADASIPGVPIVTGVRAVTVRAPGSILTVVGNPAVVGTFADSLLLLVSLPLLAILLLVESVRLLPTISGLPFCAGIHLILFCFF